jgi:hypothetical protein
LLIQTVRSSGQPPNYYIDVIQVEEAGSVVYSAEPDKGTRYEFDNIDLLFTATLDTRLADATMPNLTYNKLLSLTRLTNGITLRFIQAGNVQFSGAFRDYSEILFAAFQPVAMACDGTFTILKLNASLSELARMNASDIDKIEMVISDDLSSLLQFRANVRGRELVK